MLDDAATVGSVGELKAKDLSILFSLLKSVAWIFIDGFGLDHRNRKVATIPQEVIRALLRSPARLVADHDDAAVGKRLLFADLVVGPMRGVKLGEDVLATGISFVN